MWYEASFAANIQSSDCTLRPVIAVDMAAVMDVVSNVYQLIAKVSKRITPFGLRGFSRSDFL